MRGLALGLVLWLGSLMAAPAQVLDFEELPEWEADDHLAALQTFLQTCDLLNAPEWAPICKLAATVDANETAARNFFELLFRPVLMGHPPALFTGYYEPVLQGSRVRTGRFQYPIYRRPPELREGMTWYDRATIESGILRGRGLEIAWLDDPVDVFFLHIQGSGRIHMTDGRILRVGYAGRNGHAYRSIGALLVARGALRADALSAQSIAAWVRANPGAGAQVLNQNPSYIFFRTIGLAEDQGPVGAMGRSITALRSVAVDPAFVPLGTPVWIEKSGRDPMNRLMVAQDTGGAIKGAQRADIFYGSGPQAGLAAGEIKDGGRLVMLLPIDRAFALAQDE